VVRLVDLLDEARDRCKATLRERRQEQGQVIDEEELLSAATAMGYGAVKYADLRNSRLTNYKFNMDEMLNTKGNTAVYLLYAHARIAGIVRKSGKDVAAMAESASIMLQEPQEVLASSAFCPCSVQTTFAFSTVSWM
jgi:arginyl-tRNA synthetase